ncbi:hypothetical protein BH10PAT3_BH10PAT3_4950 [soil metagenome]
MSLLHRREEQVLDEVKYLEAELNNRLSRMMVMRLDFIKRALEHGFLKEDLPGLIADAMTEGIFPTVANHKTMNTEGYLPLLFVTVLPGGRIPSEAIDVSLTHADNNVIYGATITLNGPVRYHGGIPGTIPGYEGQYQIAGHELPYNTTKIMDDKNYEFTSMMDTHIPRS